MRLWLASTNPAFVAEHHRLGLFEGVLTNPTLLAKAHRPPREVMRDLCQASPLPVFYQLREAAIDDMKKGAAEYLGLGCPNLGIKVMVTRSGCAILHWLANERIQLRLATGAPTVTQVMLAAALGVPWITPAGSMLEELGGPGKLSLLTEMQVILDRQKSDTQLIPSLGSPVEWQSLARIGIRHGFVWERDVARFLESELVDKIGSSFAPAWQEIDQAVHPMAEQS
jgi:transaldolase